MDKITSLAEKNYLYIVFIISLVAVLGSLYYSNFVGLEPCELCWFARILSYPLLPLSAVAIGLNIKLQKALVLSLTIPGMLLTGYHYLVQKIGIGKQFLNCTKTAPCDVIDVEYLGFITIPLLAFLSFLTINIVIALAYRAKNKAEKSM